MSRRVWVALAAFALVAGAAAYLRCATHGTTPATARDRAQDLSPRLQRPGTIAGRVTPAGATVCARHVADLPRCTSADDRYELADLQPGVYFVWASADGRASRRERVELASGASVTLDLALPAGTPTGVALRGVVRDLRGAPVARATIHVTSTATDADVTTESERSGAFVVYVPAGDVDVTATAPGYVDAKVRGVAPGTVTLDLSPESSLSGVVVLAGTREPVADAVVEAGGERATTDATGRFRIGKLDPGRYKPTASAIGGYGEASESVVVRLGKSVDDLVIELYPVAIVVGRIAIAGQAAGCPPDRGGVTLSRYGSSHAYHARTLADGAIVLEGVIPGTYEVTASCEGWLSAMPYPDLVVADRDVEDVTWTVVPGGRITGTVTTTAGAPVADAVINYFAAGGAVGGFTRTRADGTYVATGVAFGAAEVSARAADFMRAESKTTTITAAEPGRADFVLDRGGSIVGDVVDETGAPVANVSVRTDGPGGGGATTDANGHFTIDTLVPGHYEIAADLGWGDSGAPVAADVALGATATVRLVAERRTNTLSGVVRDGQGRPLADVFVEAAREDEDGRRGRSGPTVLTGDDGGFAIPNVPAGSFAVRAYIKGGVETTVAHASPGTPIAITLAAACAITGTIVGQDGRPVDDATVSADSRPRELSRDERAYHTGGRFAIRDLPCSTYRVSVDGDYRSVVTVTLAAGETRDGVRLVVQPRFTIRGRLVSRSTGQPVASWKVEAPHLQSNETTGARTVITYTTETSITGADGRFLIRNMPAGEATLAAGPPAKSDDELPTIKTLVLAPGVLDVDVGDLSVSP